jgi:PAS domain S-box-containing protein
MSKAGLRPKRNSVLVAIAAVIVLLIVGLAYSQWRQYSLANAEAARTKDVLLAVDRLLLALVDAETGQRGFLLTGEQPYLEPYNRATQSVPIDLAELARLLAVRPNQSGNISRLNSLVNEKVAELRATISLRQTQGIAPAIDVVLSDEGKRRMDEIRGLCSEIQASESRLQNQAFQNREAAAAITLLATIAGGLILLFFFAFGIEPITSADPQLKPKPWPITYGTAVIATAAATLLRLSLSPLVGDTAVPFITFFPAVLFSAWYGGFRVGALSILLSAVAADYYFVPPVDSFLMTNPVDQITLLIFIVVGFGMALLSHSQRGALERAGVAEFGERTQRQQFQTTLASIGDGVIASDATGHVSFMNAVAESLTGWKREEALGRSLETVFQIVNEGTDQRVDNPALRAIREGQIVGLANHTVLISRTGTQIPIDDSGSPIKDADGNTVGAVLIFRNIAERRRAEKERELLAEQARMLSSGFDAILVRDSHDRIVSWNHVAEELYGWTGDEATGQVTHALFKTRFPRPLEEITRHLHRDNRWEGELIHTRKDGSSMTVLSHWVLDRDKEGQPRTVLEINIDISARKLAEEALREQRAWFRVTLSSIGDAVIATDRSGIVRFVNHVAESLTGFTENDCVGRPLQEIFRIFNEQTREPVENPALRAMREGMIVGLANHAVLLRKDGSEVPIDDAGSPIRSQDGTTIGAVLIFRDISQRRRLEQEREIAARTAHRLAAIVESSDDAIIGTDFDLRITSWNLAAERMFGHSAREAVGQSIRLIIPDDRWSEEDEVMQRIHGGKRVEHFETQRRKRDSSIIPVSLTVSPIYDSAGAVVGASKILRDITERKQAEERFRLAVEGAPSAMVMVDPHGRIVLANPFAERLLGYERNEMTGLSIERLVPERFRSDHLQFRTNYLAGGASQRPMGAGRDLYAVRKDGLEVPVEIGLSPIQTGEGNFVISAVTDITERKRAIEAESQARRAAEEANRAKDDFLAMLSHELRNPLSSILGWAVMLRNGKISLEEGGHALEVIERNARVEAQLVESLLDLSRIAAGKFKMDTERVDLLSVLHAVVDSLRPAVQAKNLTLDIAASSEPVAVIGDSARLQQIFSNLLTNAIKFTPRDGHIQARLDRTGSQAHIQIIDDGEGIEADFLPHIFDRFRQGESAKGRAHGGLGLGLAIVRELVHAHGGTVVADSRGKGLGSIFTVTLPIPAVIPAHIEAATHQLPRVEESSISGLRILVVDDDADARELLAVTLGSRGGIVQTASSSAEALECVHRQRPDIMVADIGMPHEDGYVLIRTLRARERERSDKRLPAIALTAYASVADRDQALSGGYDLHLAKPVGPADLTRAVAKFRRAHGA